MRYADTDEILGPHKVWPRCLSTDAVDEPEDGWQQPALAPRIGRESPQIGGSSPEPPARLRGVCTGEFAGYHRTIVAWQTDLCTNS